MFNADIRLVDALWGGGYDWIYNDTVQVATTTFSGNFAESFKQWLFDNVRSVAEAIVLGVYGIEGDDDFLEVVDLSVGRPVMCVMISKEDCYGSCV